MKLMEDILSLRNGFSEVFKCYRRIEFLIPKLVGEDLCSFNAHMIKSEISKLKEKIKHLEKKGLKDLLEQLMEEKFILNLIIWT